MKTLYSLAVAACLLGTISCELELQENPNNLSKDQADADFMLNSIQIGLQYYFHELNDENMEVIRMVAAEPRASVYENAYLPSDFDDAYTMAYAGILSDTRELIPMAKARGLHTHAGIARLIQAYTLLSLVDNFGDVPWRGAFDANNFNPVVSPGADVYADALQLLDSAVHDFAKLPLAAPKNDLFYGGDRDKWASLAHTLRLKLLLQTRLVNGAVAAKIDEIIAGGKLIDTPAEDWEFKYSTNAQNPDSRHPLFSSNYLNGSSDYLSNYYMGLLLLDKAVADPRTRYYFYRQTTHSPTANEVNLLPCVAETRPSHYSPDTPWCQLSDGYWGRDHLDTDGFPPDNQLRTNFGLYPVGGKFDANNGEAVHAGAGAKGAGIQPFMLSSFTYFMLAEAVLSMGVQGNAREYLEKGIRASMDKVLGFGAALPDSELGGLAPTTAQVNAYVDAVLQRYDAAPGTEEKLDVLVKEYFIALWGNGLEAYNTYRRTCKPASLQPALAPNPGAFIQSFPYPGVLINRNASVQAKESVGVQVFWNSNAPDCVQ